MANEKQPLSLEQLEQREQDLRKRIEQRTRLASVVLTGDIDILKAVKIGSIRSKIAPMLESAKANLAKVLSEREARLVAIAQDHLGQVTKRQEDLKKVQDYGKQGHLPPNIVKSSEEEFEILVKKPTQDKKLKEGLEILKAREEARLAKEAEQAKVTNEQPAVTQPVVKTGIAGEQTPKTFSDSEVRVSQAEQNLKDVKALVESGDLPPESIATAQQALDKAKGLPANKKDLPIAPTRENAEAQSHPDELNKEYKREAEERAREAVKRLQSQIKAALTTIAQYKEQRRAASLIRVAEEKLAKIRMSINENPDLVWALKNGIIDSDGNLPPEKTQRAIPQEILVGKEADPQATLNPVEAKEVVKEEPKEIFLNEQERSVVLGKKLVILSPLNYLVLSYMLHNKQGITGTELNEFIKSKGFGSQVGQVVFELKEKFREEVITHSKPQKNVPTVWSINEKYLDYTIREQAVQLQNENNGEFLTPDEERTLMALVNQLEGDVIIRFGQEQDSGFKVPSWIKDEYEKSNPNSETAAVSADEIREKRAAVIEKVMQIVENDAALPDGAISYLLQWMKYGDEKKAPGDIEFTGGTQRLVLTMQGFFNLLLGNDYVEIEGGKKIYQPLSDNVAASSIEKRAPEKVESKISDHRLEDIVKLSVDTIRSFSKIDERSISLDILRRQAKIKLPEEIIKEARQQKLIKIGITKTGQKECVDIKDAVFLMVMNTIKNNPEYKDLSETDRASLRNLIERYLSKPQVIELPKPIVAIEPAVIAPAAQEGSPVAAAIQPAEVFQAIPDKEEVKKRVSPETQVREAIGTILDLIGIEDADTLFTTAQISRKFTTVNPESLDKVLFGGSIKSSGNSDKGPLFGLAAVVTYFFLKDKKLKSLDGKVDVMAIAAEEIARRKKS